jgi:lysophospholipase L1-like esterase
MGSLNSFALILGLAFSSRAPQPGAPSFRAVGTHSGIDIDLKAGGSADTGDWRLYRGLTPHFVPNSKTLIAALSHPPASNGPLYVDPPSGLREGVVYYYKPQLVDRSGAIENLVPEGLGILAKDDALSSAAAMPYAPVDVVFIGDSITYGANLNDGDPTACEDCARALELGPLARQVYYSNEGHSGYTTLDYLPGTPAFTHAEDSARKLDSSNPGELIFSIMLGTNDSANGGTNGSPIDASRYQANLSSMVRTLLADFPKCKIVVNRPLWYSPNTHNGANYEEGGLERLTTYFPVISSLARKLASHRVFEGDTRGFDYFAATYLTTLNAEPGRNGTFYLHPNRVGAQALGQLWAAAISRAVH